MKKIINYIKLIARRADCLLHHIAGEDIAALFLVILVHFLAWWWALLIADAVAIAALVGKELYDAAHPETQTAELIDITSGLLGVLYVNILAVILFLL